MDNLLKDLLTDYEREETFVEKNLQDYFNSKYCFISERDKKIFLKRYVEHEKVSLIAEEYNVTTNCIHQVLKNTLNKLKHPYILRALLYGMEVYELEEERKNLLFELSFEKSKLKKTIKRCQEYDIELSNELENWFNNYMVTKDNNIKVLDLSVRTYNGLHRAGFETIQDVMNNISMLYMIRNLGKKSIKELLKKLIDYGSINQKQAEDIYYQNTNSKYVEF